MKHRRFIISDIVIVILLIFTVFFSSSVGSAGIGIINSMKIIISKIPFIGKLCDISDIKPMHEYIIFQVRLPRIVLSMLVGAGLAVTGAVFQGIFRNPLAEPHILGVSSGAALGAAIAIMFGVDMSMFGISTIGVCAFIGALATILILYAAAGLGRKSTVTGILLTGIALSTLFSAAMTLLMSLNHEKIEQIYLWTMGSFSSANWVKAGYTAVIGTAGIIVCVIFGRDLNIMSLGENTAKSLGVETARVRAVLILISSGIVAVCVSCCGIIGFAGLVVPHIIRLIAGGDYRHMLITCSLGGALFMLVCDTIARTVAAPGEISVGVITSVIGAPYLIYLIKKNMKNA